MFHQVKILPKTPTPWYSYVEAVAWITPLMNTKCSITFLERPRHLIAPTGQYNKQQMTTERFDPEVINTAPGVGTSTSMMSWSPFQMKKMRSALLSSQQLTTTTIFVRAQKLHSIDLNTRGKKLQRKRAQPLRNSKAIRAKWLSEAERNLLIHLLNIEQWTRLPFTHTLAHTNNNRQGDVHTQKLENKVHQWTSQ